MGKTSLNIKILYDQMGGSERKIADYILQNPTGLIPLSITELAQICGSSEATIVRFSRRLGFSGYQQLKISLAKEENDLEINETISSNDSPDTVFDKVCNDIYCSLEKTKSVLDKNVFKKTCDAIISADKILVFGLGNSASVAMDMAHKLLRLGINAFAYTDNHMQAIASSHLIKNCLVIGISHSGSSKDIIDALKIAKQNEATTVAITNIGKSPITKVSDLVLYTVSDETNYSILGLSSRIAQLAIIDAIYSYTVCQKKNAKIEIEKTEKSLYEKKY